MSALHRILLSGRAGGSSGIGGGDGWLLVVMVA